MSFPLDRDAVGLNGLLFVGFGGREDSSHLLNLFKGVLCLEDRIL